MVRLMMTSSKKAYATHCMTQVCCSQSPCCHGRPLLTRASSRDTQTLKSRSDSVSVGSLGPGAHNVMFEPSENLWLVWSLILNSISFPYRLVGASPLLLDIGCIFFFFLVESNILLSMVVHQ